MPIDIVKKVWEHFIIKEKYLRFPHYCRNILGDDKVNRNKVGDK